MSNRYLKTLTRNQHSSQWSAVANDTNAAATAAKAAETGRRHFVTGVLASYDGTSAIDGNVTIVFGGSTLRYEVLNNEIMSFSFPLEFDTNVTAAATLSGGGVGVRGDVAIIGYTLPA